MDRRLTNSSLVEQIRNILREDIVNLRLAPGEKLNVIALAEHFGVSRTPIRDALQLLVEEGLVIVVPRVGYYVVQLSAEDVREISGIRKMMELYAFNLAMQHLTPEKIEEMYQEALAVKDLPSEKRHPAFEKLDRTFHADIIRFAGNRHLLELSAKIHAYFDLMRNLNVRVEEALEEHLAILRAMRNGDVTEAQKMLEIHLDTVTKAILAIIPDRTGRETGRE
ncbi:MAG: GntR family transcriptional regulator [Firmicutes bacterium]|nr:GntR family transcriptional regulator [Bacillota bacterium]